MHKDSKRDSKRETHTPVREGTGAKGGREALKPEEQAPAGVDPDSEVDAQLRRDQGPPPGGLNPGTIVRN